VDLLARLRDDGHGVVAVTHDEAFVASLADRVANLCSASVEEAARTAGSAR
jgi:energy-coupling factor transport system ATP-binding protein